MFKTGWANRIAFMALLIGMATASSHAQPRSGIYRIQSGTYREVGGFVGEMDYGLPYAGQTFISLKLGSAGVTADLEFLTTNRQPFYIRLTNGIVTGNTIQFQYQTTHPYGSDLPPAYVNYTVTNAAGFLWFSGSVTSPPVCCDIPYRFEHIDVRATLAPTVAIHAASGMEICWNSESNQTYQVQCHTNPAGPGWSDLGGPIQGDGMVTCVTDSNVPGRAQRFYRVVLVP